jgi:hypothetical protein
MKQTKRRKNKSAHKTLHKQSITYYSQCTQLEKKINKAIPDTGFGGLLSCETSRLSHCLDHQLGYSPAAFYYPRIILTKYLLVLIYVRG